jgi:glycerol kinase
MSEKDFVLALDQGTTSTRAIVFDREGRARATAQIPLTQIYPAPGQVERDPDEIWRSVLHVGRQLLREVDVNSIAAIGTPISARRRSCGSGRAASRLPMPSSGKTAEPLHFAPS